MDIAFQPGNALEARAGALIVPIPAGEAARQASPLLGELDDRLSGHLRALADEAGFSGKAGSTLVAPTLGQLPATRVILVGIGDAGRLDAATLARSYGAAGLAAREAGARDVALALPASANLSASAAVEAATLGLHLALYRFTRHHGAGHQTERPNVERAVIVSDALSAEEAATALARADAVAEGVALARDLVNEPASVLTPERMAEIAAQVAAKAGLAIEALDEAALAALGANAILAVGMGSAHKPRLIRLRYTPQNTAVGDRVVGLVGKCITFDTGGYSIKTYEGMLEMKGDMAGGAAVLGVMSALSALGCRVPVEATICAAENMISGEAFRPGDIIRALNGVAIEVLSTDAEGRLVLADGLVDMARRGATELIDLATLTGAAVVALGEGTTALFSSDDDLAARLLAAAAEAGERMWRMPLIDELNEKIKGDVGDVKNSGGRAGGAITAALFLQRFTEGLPWAHFDIAGSARLPKAGPEGPKGASGVGVRTLLDYLVPGATG
jgi:leucyl aminopeptidase